MSRSGNANFVHHTFGPNTRDIFWREVMRKDKCDHQYHPLNLPPASPSFAAVTTINNDYYGKTWNIMNHTYSSAAGKSSYFYNVAKPAGNVVRMGSTSASTFDPYRPNAFISSPEDVGVPAWRRARSESPMALGSRPPSFRSTLAATAGVGWVGVADPYQEAMGETSYGPGTRQIGLHMGGGQTAQVGGISAGAGRRSRSASREA